MVATTLSPKDIETRSGRITSTTAYDIAVGERQHLAWRRITGREPVMEPTEQMLLGVALEPGIIQMAEHKTGLKFLKPGTTVHPEKDWAATSIDGLGYPHDQLDGRPVIGLETKAHGFGRAEEFGEEGTDQVPERTYVQACWHMFVHDLPACLVVPLMGGYILRAPVYRVARDRDGVEAALIYKCERFYHDYVKADVEPPPDGDDSTTTYIRDRYKRAHRDVIEADAELERLMRDLGPLRQQHKALGEKKTAIENQIKARIGDATGARGDGWRVSWSNVKGKLQVDWRALANELAGGSVNSSLRDKYTTPGADYRRFAPKWMGQ